MILNSDYSNSFPQVSIGIPVYGLTVQLLESLSACLSFSNQCFSFGTIYIVNSGPSFVLPDFILSNSLNVNILVKDVPSDYFWSRSVAEIYSLFKSDSSTHLLLMNHDCYPTPSCLDNLVSTHLSLGNNSVCHSILIYFLTHDIWWSGTYLQPFRRPRFRKDLSDKSEFPQTPILTSSTMGQCLLMPRLAVNIDFLHFNILPHYFSDSVQTSEMRRHGFPLYVDPKSIAYVDQSDQSDKVKWLGSYSWLDILRILFHPKSSRNLKAVFFSTVYHRDSFFVGIACAVYEVLGKIAITILEFFANTSNLPFLRSFTTASRLQ